LKEFVIEIGFMPSRVHGGLLRLEEQGTAVAAVILYVDDLLIIAIEGLIGQINDEMRKRFWVHNLGGVCLYLGMTIKRNWEHHTTDIHQHSGIRTIIANFNIDESRQVAMPMAIKVHKRRPDKESSVPTIYQSMILIYGGVC
jgi:hypothetical protein